MKLSIVAGSLLLAGALASECVHAQSYPARPVRILVPLAAGGGMDTITRGLGIKLADSFGQTVVVDNRPGAGSLVALDILAGSAPDGHTLMMISATTVVYPILYKSRYDIVRDFTPVTQVTAQGYALVVHPSIPAKSVSELVQYIRARPGKLNYASSGIGSPIHMSTELFQFATGTRMTHVPFKGMGAAYADLVGGRIELSFATIISSLPHVTAGRLRALAVTGKKRIASLPDIPTLDESDLPGFVVTTWQGIFAPAGIPPSLLARVNAEFVKAVHSPELRPKIEQQDMDPTGASVADFRKFYYAELARWTKVAKDAGLKAN